MSNPPPPFSFHPRNKAPIKVKRTFDKRHTIKVSASVHINTCPQKIDTALRKAQLDPATEQAETNKVVYYLAVALARALCTLFLPYLDGNTGNVTCHEVNNGTNSNNNNDAVNDLGRAWERELFGGRHVVSDDFCPAYTGLMIGRPAVLALRRTGEDGDDVDVAVDDQEVTRFTSIPPGRLSTRSPFPYGKKKKIDTDGNETAPPQTFPTSGRTNPDPSHAEECSQGPGRGQHIQNPTTDDLYPATVIHLLQRQAWERVTRLNLTKILLNTANHPLAKTRQFPQRYGVA